MTVFALGLVETLFSADDEQTDREYAFIEQAIRTNDSLNIKYGKPRSFSSHHSYRQRVDTSNYSFIVEYEHKDIHLKYTIITDEKNRSKIHSLSEFKGNLEVVKDKFF